ncbi:hypothetical protein [Tahibacter soli]|uniref:Uncharacterized protein n=1 Tax=Tahibacter soli TaxID=2983605 RepID=A0A9X3YMM1_9GAMM|nr:hypothetical protein [Tahibacter soli]MDC8015097.1 hypothetical protein [Tahibacter soli]
MRTLRTLETRALGYAIERVDERDHLGTVRASWYEVLSPQDGSVIGTAADRATAERVVISRELDIARRAVALNAAGIAA